VKKRSQLATKMIGKRPLWRAAPQAQLARSAPLIRSSAVKTLCPRLPGATVRGRRGSSRLLKVEPPSWKQSVLSQGLERRASPASGPSPGTGQRTASPIVMNSSGLSSLAQIVTRGGRSRILAAAHQLHARPATPGVFFAIRRTRYVALTRLLQLRPCLPGEIPGASKTKPRKFAGLCLQHIGRRGSGGTGAYPNALYEQ
jgi:hypothetical protein